MYYFCSKGLFQIKSCVCALTQGAAPAQAALHTLIQQSPQVLTGCDIAVPVHRHPQDSDSDALPQQHPSCAPGPQPAAGTGWLCHQDRTPHARLNTASAGLTQSNKQAPHSRLKGYSLAWSCLENVEICECTFY